MKAKVISTGEVVEVYHETQHGQQEFIYKEAVLVNGRVWKEAELEFIQEVPASDDLEEAAYNFVMDNFGNPKEPLYKFNQRCFKTGAKWQAEQFEKNRLAACDKQTEEEAQIEDDFVTQHLKKNNRTPTFIDAIEYGMKLQEEKDNICYEEIIEEGAKWKYDEMMKNAIEGFVCSQEKDMAIVKSKIFFPTDLKKGDKVKVIVIKED